MQNDLQQVQLLLEPPSIPPPIEDDELKMFLSHLRAVER